MAIGLPPATHPLHKMPMFNRHSQNIPTTKTTVKSDSITISQQRQSVLNALKDPSIFMTVFDEKNTQPTAQIQTIRKALKAQKITPQELIGTPELLINFYEHLAREGVRQLHAESNKQKQADLAFQIVMLKMAANLVRKNHGMPVKNLEKDLQLAANGKPLFAGLLIGIFKAPIIFFTNPGDPFNTSPEERLRKSNAIINHYSRAAGLAAGSLTKLFLADEAALSGTTVMCLLHMARSVYGIDGASEATIGVIGSKLMTTRLVDGAVDFAIEKGLSWIPFIGEIVSATSAFGVHQAICRTFRAYFEHQVDQKKTPGFPPSIRALTAGLAIADTAGALDFDTQAEADMHNRQNDLRVAHGSAVSAGTAFAESSDSHQLYEIRQVRDTDGRILTHPNKDWWFNKLANTGNDIATVSEIAVKASQMNRQSALRYAEKVVNETKRFGAPSAKTIAELADATDTVLAGGKLAKTQAGNALDAIQQQPSYLSKLWNWLTSWFF